MSALILSAIEQGGLADVLVARRAKDFEALAAAKARLEALATHTDGFELAELDLELRREGELLGLNQSGLPTLRIASLREKGDRDRAVQARSIAERILDEHGALLPAYEALGAELRSGWLARVGAGEVLAEVAETADAEPSQSRTAASDE